MVNVTSCSFWLQRILHQKCEKTLLKRINDAIFNACWMLKTLFCLCIYLAWPQMQNFTFPTFTVKNFFAVRVQNFLHTESTSGDNGIRSFFPNFRYFLQPRKISHFLRKKSWTWVFFLFGKKIEIARKKKSFDEMKSFILLRQIHFLMI